MKSKLPKFMNFEAVGVLLYDKKLDKLYSVTEESKVETDIQDETDTMIKFPSTLGITGIVFQSGEIYISNKATKETKMRSDIDNLSSCTDVYNFMIGPIYGENKETPIGIVQFFNKKSKDGITEFDKERFIAIQRLLGMWVENTNEMSLIVNVTKKM